MPRLTFVFVFGVSMYGVFVGLTFSRAFDFVFFLSVAVVCLNWYYVPRHKKKG